MEDLNKLRESIDELRDLAKKHGICVVTATQPSREPKSGYVHLPKNRFNQEPHVIMVDYQSLIKN